MEVQPASLLFAACVRHTCMHNSSVFKIYDLFIAEDLPYSGQSLARAHKISTHTQQQEYRLALRQVYVWVLIGVLLPHFTTAIFPYHFFFFSFISSSHSSFLHSLQYLFPLSLLPFCLFFFLSFLPFFLWFFSPFLNPFLSSPQLLSSPLFSSHIVFSQLSWHLLFIYSFLLTALHLLTLISSHCLSHLYMIYTITCFLETWA